MFGFPIQQQTMVLHLSVIKNVVFLMHWISKSMLPAFRFMNIMHVDMSQEFIRARSDEQKCIRMSCIKKAADELFSEMPYHRITLTTIAERLGASRAQIYRYASTKEEIYLSIAEDSRRECLGAFLASFPEGAAYCDETIAEIWTELLNRNRRFLLYSELLPSIIEANVSVERLASFKERYYEDSDAVAMRLSSNLKISIEAASDLYEEVFFYARGLVSLCEVSPLMQQALERIGRKREADAMRQKLKPFILMCLERARSI